MHRICGIYFASVVNNNIHFCLYSIKVRFAIKNASCHICFRCFVLFSFIFSFHSILHGTIVLYGKRFINRYHVIIDPEIVFILSNYTAHTFAQVNQFHVIDFRYPHGMSCEYIVSQVASSDYDMNIYNVRIRI